MTLYLLFEQLDKGALTLQSRIPISEHAAAQEPSKLGLEPGETISVEDAIKAVVTRSANDIAVAIAEAIGHDESTFAEMMTRKAHALGMSSTIYRNASGLPNDEQITTARDLTILARSLEERFPRYFRYFSTDEFDYAGETIGNHNHLLGRVDGVDGIKTGYTRASGFNLLTSVHRDGRSLVAVVMGGRSAPRARPDHGEPDRRPHRARLDGPHRDRGRRRVRVRAIRRAAPPAPARPRPAVVAANVPTRLSAARAAPADEGEGDNAEDDDDADASRRGRPGRRPAASRAPSAAPRADRAARRVVEAAPAPKKPAPPPIPPGWMKGPDAAAPTPPAKPKADADARPTGKTPPRPRSPRARPTRPTTTTRRRGKGWKIQIGATEDAAKATALLDRARAARPRACSPPPSP